MAVNTRIDLWRKQKGRCFYCQRFLVPRKKHNGVWSPLNDDSPTLDHYIPKSHIPREIRWAYRETDNLVLACYGCNYAKGNQIPLEGNQRVGPYRLVNEGWIWDPPAIATE